MSRILNSESHDFKVLLGMIHSQTVHSCFINYTILTWNDVIPDIPYLYVTLVAVSLILKTLFFFKILFFLFEKERENTSRVGRGSGTSSHPDERGARHRALSHNSEIVT